MIHITNVNEEDRAPKLGNYGILKLRLVQYRVHFYLVMAGIGNSDLIPDLTTEPAFNRMTMSDRNALTAKINQYSVINNYGGISFNPNYRSAPATELSGDLNHRVTVMDASVGDLFTLMCLPLNYRTYRDLIDKPEVAAEMYRYPALMRGVFWLDQREEPVEYEEEWSLIGEDKFLEDEAFTPINPLSREFFYHGRHTANHIGTAWSLDNEDAVLVTIYPGESKIGDFHYEHR